MHRPSPSYSSTTKCNCLEAAAAVAVTPPQSPILLPPVHDSGTSMEGNKALSCRGAANSSFAIQTTNANICRRFAGNILNAFLRENECAIILIEDEKWFRTQLLALFSSATAIHPTPPTIQPLSYFTSINVTLKLICWMPL